MVINIGKKKNQSKLKINIISDDEIILNSDLENSILNLKNNSKSPLNRGNLYFLVFDRQDQNSKIYFRISNNMEIDYYYYLKEAIIPIPEFKNKLFNFVYNSNLKIIYYTILDSNYEIVETEYYILEDLKRIYLTINNNTTEFENFNWPYIILKTYDIPSNITKLKIINIENYEVSELHIKNTKFNSQFKIEDENLYSTVYDFQKGIPRIIKTDFKLNKNYSLNWKTEFVNNKLKYLILSKNNRKILLNLENTNNLFDIGLIKNDFYNITIDQFDTEKTPYWFGNLADWDNTNLFRLEKSDIKYEDLEWIELDDEDWSFSEIIEEPQTLVFPNPNFGYLTIEVEDLIEKVALLDNQGKIILEMENPEINGNAFQNQHFIKEVEGASGWSIRNTNSPIVYFIFSFANGKKVTKKIMTAK